MHPTLRSFLERSLARIARLGGNYRVRGRALILAYHNVLSPGKTARGDASLHLAFADFCTQLDLIQAHGEVVPLASLADPASRPERPRVAVTFDDAYRGALRVALPELVRRHLPATFFVSPGLLGDQSFWWDQAAVASEDSAVPAARRSEALEALRGEGAAIRGEWAKRGTPLEPHLLPEEFRSASEQELAVAASAPGVTLGAHTVSHPNLAAVDERELRGELRDSLAYLQARFPGVTIPWIAYPYGLYDERVMAAARETGYRAGLKVEGGWLRRGERPALDTPRMNVPAGISAERFLLRLTAFPGL